MTLETFFDALAACKDQFIWHLDHEGLRGHWRGDDHTCCPLTAVAQARTGMRWSVDDPDEAGIELDLDMESIETITWAADAHGDSDVRTQLLACVGLREVP